MHDAAHGLPSSSAVSPKRSPGRRIEELIVGLASDDPVERIRSRHQLGAVGKAAVPTLCERLNDGHHRIRWEAAKCLQAIADPSAAEALVDELGDADSDVRWVLRESDLVLVPVSASQADVWATDDILDLAGRAGKPTHIVMNRTRSGTRVGEHVAQSVAELEATQLQSSLANRVVYAEALGRGLGVMEAKRNNVASDEVHALAREVSAILGL